ncbi:MAG TPA: hypothetical protein VMV69_06590 [Pirellulales bacterium]|nr:hypothetical protein [Pirellulales bacterium]
MNHHPAFKQGHGPSAQGNWPLPNEIRQRAQCIRRHWTHRECGLRERLAKRRQLALVEQLLS